MSARHWSAEWQRARREAKDRAAWRCERCGRAGRLEVHHRVPVEAGGTDDPENLEVLCRDCHVDEHATEPTDAERRWTALVDELRHESN